jgi:hypothetical protein
MLEGVMRLGGWLLLGAVGLALTVATALAHGASTARRAVLLPLVGAAPAGPPTPIDEKAAARATATAVAGLPTAADPPGPGVAALLASPPAAGQLVEVDAYFAGADPRVMRRGSPTLPDVVECPDLPASVLTDRPFPPSYQVLNMWASNMPPDDAPWLAAITPEVATPGSHRFTNLPYHARLRGRLGDPRVAHCRRPERVFMVEAIVAVYPDAPPSPAGPWSAPPGLADWPRRREPGLGLSLAVPPGWAVEPLAEPGLVGGLALRAPEWPDRPVLLRVHPGETWYDWLAPTVRPPLFEGATSYGVYQQGQFPRWGPTQGLSGWHASRSFPGERSESVLFNGGGRTHELTVRFPIGYDVPQGLLTAYTAIVEGFALDQQPGPTPTPPIKQTLGPGPFISREEALTLARQRHGGELELVAARLVPEAEARGLSALCSHFNGHPEGVWLLNVRGDFNRRIEEYRLYLEATTGAALCGEPADSPRPLPTWTPGGAPPTPGPTATIVPTSAPPR